MKSTTDPSAAVPSSAAARCSTTSRANGCAICALKARREDEAVARLHALLLRAARFECARRRPALPHLRGNDLDDIANQAADDALVSVLARLDDFRGASRFTTWVYKFALLEAAVKLRKRSWQGREVPLEPESWSLFASAAIEPDEEVEQSELLATLQQAIAEVLTPHQRQCAGCPRSERRSDRRARRAAGHQPWRALQDAARRAAKAAQASRRARPVPRRTIGGGALMERPELKQALGRLLGPAGPEVGCDVCFDELDRYVELEAGRPGCRRRDPRFARAPRRVSRLPRGAREPVRARQRRAGSLTSSTAAFGLGVARGGYARSNRSVTPLPSIEVWSGRP